MKKEEVPQPTKRETLRDDFPPGTEGECAFIKAQLASHQKEVITMCKQYDKIIMKQKSKMGFVDLDSSNSEFALIKKSITIITSLEELVQHSTGQMQQITDKATERAEMASRECV